MSFLSSRRLFMGLFFLGFLALLVIPRHAEAKGADGEGLPNIIWLSIEDISPHLGCYGYKQARTPTLDRLATESTLYENAFVCAPVCAPCRSSVITGVYPTSLGTHNMRSTVKLPPEVRPFTQYLRDAGYYCTNHSKKDYQFQAPAGTWDDSSKQAHWKNRPNSNQPFFAVFNYGGTHESAVRGDQGKYDQVLATLSEDERHDPATLELPPYYPDTPKVRADWARYYNCITAMDKWVAERLAEIDQAGVADNTIVFYWSDHGVGLPRGKRWLYDSGIKVPLMVRLPKKYQNSLGVESSGKGAPGNSFSGNSGLRTDRLVSLVDLAPTVLNLAGIAIPDVMQGQPFMGPNLPAEREFVFAARDRMDERYDKIRCIRTKQYKYIRNFMPQRPYAQWTSYAERGATMQEIRRLHVEGKLNESQALFMRSKKPREELYDMVADPHELHNLLDRSENFNSVRLALAAKLEENMRNIYDLGLLSEAELDTKVKQAGSRYAIFRQSKGEKRTDGKAEYEKILQAALSQQASPPQPSLSELLDAFENAKSPWDRLQAANLLDLFPDFEQQAGELRPVVLRVRAKLQKQSKQASVSHRQALGYLDRCVTRLEERLGL